MYYLTMYYVLFMYHLGDILFGFLSNKEQGQWKKDRICTILPLRVLRGNGRLRRIIQIIHKGARNKEQGQ